MITAVWAQDITGLIGKGAHLPWHIPEDLRHFKELTQGKTIVMGKSTYDGIGRPLPNRKTIVMTSGSYINHPDVLTIDSIAKVLDYAADHGDIYIAGGVSIYEQFLPYCDQIIRTLINGEYYGDKYMQPIDKSKWMLSSVVEYDIMSVETWKPL